MGCSWFSLGSLAVLILAFFQANMQADSQTSGPGTTTKEFQRTDESKETRKMSDILTEQVTKEMFTVNITDLPQNCTFDHFGQFSNATDDSNSSEISNCMYLMSTSTSFVENVSANGTTIRNVVLKKSYRDFPEYKHYKNLDHLTTYIATVPGFITNFLSVFIASKITPRHTTEIYMIVLGLADLTTVSSRLLSRLLTTLNVSRKDWECKLLYYIISVGQLYSNLILMTWTLERFIAVIFPMKLGVWCSIRNTKIMLFGLCLFSLGISTIYATDTNAVTFMAGQTSFTVCHMSTFIYGLWIHIESVYYIYIPVFVVALCNIFIIVKLNEMMKARSSMTSNQETIDKKTQENRRMTILLLSISAAFLLLHMPYILASVLTYVYPDFSLVSKEDPHTFAKVLLYTSLGYVLSEYQNCINFFLYCLSGTKFRQTFKRLFCKCIATEPIDKRQTSRTDTTKI